MTALSSPTSIDGPVQNLLDASTNSYANFAGQKGKGLIAVSFVSCGFQTGTGWAFPVWVVFDLHSSIQVAGFEVKPHKAAAWTESPVSRTRVSRSRFCQEFKALRLRILTRLSGPREARAEAGAPKRLALGFCDTSTAGPWLPAPRPQRAFFGERHVFGSSNLLEN